MEMAFINPFPTRVLEVREPASMAIPVKHIFPAIKTVIRAKIFPWMVTSKKK